MKTSLNQAFHVFKLNKQSGNVHLNFMNSWSRYVIVTNKTRGVKRGLM